MATDREPEALPEDISLEDLEDHARTLHEAALAGESDARRPSRALFRQSIVVEAATGAPGHREGIRLCELAQTQVVVTSRNTKCANSSPAPAHSFASNASSCACRSYGMKLGNHHDLRAAG